MRSKLVILDDGTRPDILSLEVLLDIRDILFDMNKKAKKPKVKRKVNANTKS